MALASFDRQWQGLFGQCGPIERRHDALQRCCIPLLTTHDQGGRGSMTYHGVSDAPEENPSHRTASVSAHDDEVGCTGGGVDLLGGIAERHRGGYAPALITERSCNCLQVGLAVSCSGTQLREVGAVRLYAKHLDLDGAGSFHRYSTRLRRARSIKVEPVDRQAELRSAHRWRSHHWRDENWLSLPCAEASRARSV